MSKVDDDKAGGYKEETFIQINCESQKQQKLPLERKYAAWKIFFFYVSTNVNHNFLPKHIQYI